MKEEMDSREQISMALAVVERAVVVAQAAPPSGLTPSQVRARNLEYEASLQTVERVADLVLRKTKPDKAVIAQAEPKPADKPAVVEQKNDQQPTST